jgi:hypothetical protein
VVAQLEDNRFHFNAPALPPSHEVLSNAMDEVGRKAVASEIGVSAALVHKWCEPTGADASGALNPLDRVLTLCIATGSKEPARWLAGNLGCFVVPNPEPPKPSEKDLKLCRETQGLLTEFSELLKAVTDSGAEIDPTEAACIRQRWEDLKLAGEKFTCAAEAGHFGGSR